jgi:hypothetical protein
MTLLSFERSKTSNSSGNFLPFEVSLAKEDLNSKLEVKAVDFEFLIVVINVVVLHNTHIYNSLEKRTFAEASS